MNKIKVLTVFGTHPDAIKMAPLTKKLAADNTFNKKVCVTGQHRQMLDQILALFELQPDFDLNIMQVGQDLSDITLRILQQMKNVFAQFRPNVVLVHGDTTTTFATSLACYYQQIPVGHVEVEQLLNDDNSYRTMAAAHNPYGDGRACERIMNVLKQTFSQN